MTDEYEAGEGVPHFFAGIEDVEELFADMSFELAPVEEKEYLLPERSNVSTHWVLLLSKPN